MGLHVSLFPFNRDENVYEWTTFQALTEIKENLTIHGTINDVNFDHFVADAVLLDKEQNITGHKIFNCSEIIVKYTLQTKDLRVKEHVNDINITWLFSDILDSSSNQLIAGSKIFTELVDLHHNNHVHLLNGFNISEEFVTVNREQSIDGK